MPLPPVTSSSSSSASSSASSAANVRRGLSDSEIAAAREGIDPKPQPAAQYGASFSGWQRWAELEVAPDVTTGGPQVPNLAEAGKPFTVRTSKTLADMGASGALKALTLCWQIDGGAVQRLPLVDGLRDMRTGELLRRDGTIAVPEDARGDLAYWFELETTDGALHYDSDFGNNFHATIVPAGGAVLRFDDWWGRQQLGDLVAGEALRIDYDTDRLKQFLYATNHHGYETWGVSAFVQFDTPNGPTAPLEVPLTIVQRGAMGTAVATQTFEPAVPIPLDATRASLWFRGTSYGGSSTGGGPAWDSALGDNYRYDVKPR
jgi:hypothetical protein